MEQAPDVHRLRFAFTVRQHCIFPQHTVGLADILRNF